MTSGADDLDTTLPNVMLDQSDLDLPDVGVSDDESDGKQTVHIFSDFNSPFCFAVWTNRLLVVENQRKGKNLL